MDTPKNRTVCRIKNLDLITFLLYRLPHPCPIGVVILNFRTFARHLETVKSSSESAVEKIEDAPLPNGKEYSILMQCLILTKKNEGDNSMKLK